MYNTYVCIYIYIDHIDHEIRPPYTTPYTTPYSRLYIYIHINICIHACIFTTGALQMHQESPWLLA